MGQGHLRVGGAEAFRALPRVFPLTPITEKVNARDGCGSSFLCKEE